MHKAPPLEAGLSLTSHGLNNISPDTVRLIKMSADQCNLPPGREVRGCIILSTLHLKRQAEIPVVMSFLIMRICFPGLPEHKWLFRMTCRLTNTDHTVVGL